MTRLSNDQINSVATQLLHRMISAHKSTSVDQDLLKDLYDSLNKLDTSNFYKVIVLKKVIDQFWEAEDNYFFRKKFDLYKVYEEVETPINTVMNILNMRENINNTAIQLLAVINQANTNTFISPQDKITKIDQEIKSLKQEKLDQIELEQEILSKLYDISSSYDLYKKSLHDLYDFCKLLIERFHHNNEYVDELERILKEIKDELNEFSAERSAGSQILGWKSKSSMLALLIKIKSHHNIKNKLLSADLNANFGLSYINIDIYNAISACLKLSKKEKASLDDNAEFKDLDERISKLKFKNAVNYKKLIKINKEYLYHDNFMLNILGKQQYGVDDMSAFLMYYVKNAYIDYYFATQESPKDQAEIDAELMRTIKSAYSYYCAANGVSPPNLDKDVSELLVKIKLEYDYLRNYFEGINPEKKFDVNKIISAGFSYLQLRKYDTNKLIIAFYEYLQSIDDKKKIALLTNLIHFIYPQKNIFSIEMPTIAALLLYGVTNQKNSLLKEIVNIINQTNEFEQERAKTLLEYMQKNCSFSGNSTRLAMIASDADIARQSLINAAIKFTNTMVRVFLHADMKFAQKLVNDLSAEFIDKVKKEKIKYATTNYVDMQEQDLINSSVNLMSGIMSAYYCTNDQARTDELARAAIDFVNKNKLTTKQKEVLKNNSDDHVLEDNLVASAAELLRKIVSAYYEPDDEVHKQDLASSVIEFMDAIKLTYFKARNLNDNDAENSKNIELNSKIRNLHDYLLEFKKTVVNAVTKYLQELNPDSTPLSNLLSKSQLIEVVGEIIQLIYPTKKYSWLVELPTPKAIVISMALKSGYDNTGHLEKIISIINNTIEHENIRAEKLIKYLATQVGAYMTITKELFDKMSDKDENLVINPQVAMDSYVDSLSCLLEYSDFALKQMEKIKNESASTESKDLDDICLKLKDIILRNKLYYDNFKAIPSNLDKLIEDSEYVMEVWDDLKKSVQNEIEQKHLVPEKSTETENKPKFFHQKIKSRFDRYYKENEISKIKELESQRIKYAKEGLSQEIKLLWMKKTQLNSKQLGRIEEIEAKNRSNISRLNKVKTFFKKPKNRHLMIEYVGSKFKDEYLSKAEALKKVFIDSCKNPKERQLSSGVSGIFNDVAPFTYIEAVNSIYEYVQKLDFNKMGFLISLINQIDHDLNNSILNNPLLPPKSMGMQPFMVRAYVADKIGTVESRLGHLSTVIDIVLPNITQSVEERAQNLLAFMTKEHDKHLLGANKKLLSKPNNMTLEDKSQDEAVLLYGKILDELSLYSALVSKQVISMDIDGANKTKFSNILTTVVGNINKLKGNKGSIDFSKAISCTEMISNIDKELEQIIMDRIQANEPLPQDILQNQKKSNSCSKILLSLFYGLYNLMLKMKNKFDKYYKSKEHEKIDHLQEENINLQKENKERQFKLLWLKESNLDPATLENMRNLKKNVNDNSEKLKKIKSILKEKPS